MGWRCNQCSAAGPDHGAIWCPECGNRDLGQTDDSGLTLDDRKEQTAMFREHVAEEREARIYGYTALVTSAIIAIVVALLFFAESAWRDAAAIAVFFALIMLASLIDEPSDYPTDYVMYPWVDILERARIATSLRTRQPTSPSHEPAIDDQTPW